jgi:cell division protein FtsQ
VVVIIFAALSVTVVFNVREVVIKGESIYSDDEIIEAGNIEVGMNLIRFGKSGSVQAQSDIMDSLTHLDSVTVERSYPSAITITVESAERAFSVYSDETHFEISGKGRVINSSLKRPAGLVVTGLFPSEDSMSEMVKIGDSIKCVDNAGVIDSDKTDLVFQIDDLIEKHELDEISRVDIVDRFDIRMFNGEDERVEVKLGAPTQLDEKFAIAAKIIKDEIAPEEKGVLRITGSRRASFNPVY